MSATRKKKHVTWLEPVSRGKGAGFPHRAKCSCGFQSTQPSYQLADARRQDHLRFANLTSAEREALRS